MPKQPGVQRPGFIPKKPYKQVLLVTLLCPNCHARVAVMDHFPRYDGDVRPGDITYVYDGSSVKNVSRLFCRRCFMSFPPHKAGFPEHTFLKWTHDPAMNPLP